jgi:uncharacterized protein YbaP (TraB family)
MLRFCWFACFAIFCLVASQPLAAAEEQKPFSAPEQCAGHDMLLEMRDKEPDHYRQVMDEAAKLENAEAILWKVEKSGSEPSFLFGTIHMPDKRIATLSPTVKTAFDQANTVALEVAGTSGDALTAVIKKSPQLLAYADGKSLQAQLTENEFKKAQALVAKTGLPGQTAAVLKPWFISLLLSISDCQRDQAKAGMDALDVRLEKTAKERGASVVGLETAEGQIAAMANIPEDQQLQMLKAGLAYADRTDDMIETLVQMYLHRQTGATMPFQLALAEKSGIPASAFEAFNTMLLTDRNAKMRDAALPLFEKGRAFVAVGALHLSGKAGLVALLRESGYTVTAVE